MNAHSVHLLLIGMQVARVRPLVWWSLCTDTRVFYPNMGIDSAIRKWLEERVAPGAFTRGGSGTLPAGDTVYVEDILTRMFRIRGRRLGNYFTGRDLFNAVVLPHIERMRYSPSICVSVLCADDIDRVPREKLETQISRSRQFTKTRVAKAARVDADGSIDMDSSSDDDTAGAREHKSSRPDATPLRGAGSSHGMESGATARSLSPDFRYPSSTTIDDDGVRYVDDEGVSRFEVIDLPVLLRSRHARNVIWPYFIECLSSFGASSDGPPGAVTNDDAVLIIDQLRDGPVAFSGRSVYRLPPHSIGEGEMQSAMWAMVFHDRPVVVSTIDSDFLPLGLLAASVRSQPLFWSYQVGTAPETHVDMNALLGAVRDKTGLDIELFRALCILSGTDFFAKRDVLNQVGMMSILQAVWRAQIHVRASADEGNANEERESHFMWFLRSAFATQMGIHPQDEPPTFDDMQAHIHARRLRKYTLPSDSIGDAVRRFAWNMRYWSLHSFQATTSVYGALRDVKRGTPWRPQAAFAVRVPERAPRGMPVIPALCESFSTDAGPLPVDFETPAWHLHSHT